MPRTTVRARRGARRAQTASNAAYEPARWTSITLPEPAVEDEGRVRVAAVDPLVPAGAGQPAGQRAVRGGRHVVEPQVPLQEKKALEVGRRRGEHLHRVMSQ